MANICQTSTEALLVAALAFDEAEKERITAKKIQDAVIELDAEA